MKPGRDFDIVIAQEVMGQAILGQPIPPYSTDIEAAFEVARKLGVTLIPIEGGQWFAFVGPKSGWAGPADFLKCLSNGEFARSGAAVDESPAYSICLAAFNAVQQRAAQPQKPTDADKDMGLTH